MTCNTSSIMVLARCYQGMPKPVIRALNLALLCQWANESAAPVLPGKAINPTPYNTNDHVGVFGLGVAPVGPTLSWQSGGNTTGYDVWFNGVQVGFNQPGTTFALALPLAYTTAYTWRIDSINADGTTIGDVWTFTTDPAFSYTPSPAVQITWWEHTAGGPFTDTLANFNLNANFGDVYRVTLDGILTIQGIHNLPALENLRSENGSLALADIRDMTFLTDLDLSNNGFAVLDLDGVHNLVNLVLSSNNIAAIDLSGNLNLATIALPGNLLPSFDATGRTTLINLNVSGNLLGFLKLTGCTSLNDLACSNNFLVGIIDFSDCALSLVTIDAGFNSLTAAGFSLAGFSVISLVSIGSNLIASLPLTGCVSLVNLVCDGNQLTALDVSASLNMQGLYCPTQYSGGVPVLADLRIGDSPFYNDMEAPDNALPAGPHGVDEALNKLATNCLGNLGLCDLNTFGTNAPPTGGLLNPDYIALNTAGWTVFIN